MITTTIPAEQLVIINPRIEIWSGTVQLDREKELPNAGPQPPKALVSDGRKLLVPKLALNPLNNVRKQIERALKSDGFRYEDIGIALTPHKAEGFLAQWPSFEQSFRSALDALVKNLDQHYADQEALYPAWASMLSTSRLSAAEVRHRCKFRVSVFRTAPPDTKDLASAANQHYDNMMQNALPVLLEDIAGDAKELVTKFQGRARVKQSQVDPVKHLVSKLKGFAFLDPRVQPFAAGLTAVLDTLPVTGALSTSEVALCITVLQQLANPAMIVSHGTGVIIANQSATTLDAIETPVEDVRLIHMDQHELPGLEIPMPPMPAPRRRGFAVAL